MRIRFHHPAGRNPAQYYGRCHSPHRMNPIWFRSEWESALSRSVLWRFITRDKNCCGFPCKQGLQGNWSLSFASVVNCPLISSSLSPTFFFEKGIRGGKMPAQGCIKLVIHWVLSRRDSDNSPTLQRWEVTPAIQVPK